MSTPESTATDMSDGAKKTDQVSTASKDATTDRRDDIQIVQNVLLIWLGNNIDENNEDYRNTISQLHRIFNTIYKFTDSEKCITFINSIDKGQVCMVITDTLEQHIVPRIHNMPQMNSIFILSSNEKQHEPQWINEWSKIKGVVREISSIYEVLKQAAHQYEQNLVSISFITTSEDMVKKNLNEFDCSFICTQVIKEILLTIKFEGDHIKEFIQHCQDVFANNKEQLRNINELERNYHDKTPIWWYTCESFLYPMLNRALQLMDVDLIIKMSFFIADLHRHIEQLYDKQFNDHLTDETFMIYHGQGLLRTDFDQMAKTKGGLMSFNNFLSASKDRNISLNFARRALLNPDMVGILFVMTIDPSKAKTPFASIKGVSYFGEEDKVLFSIPSVFRISDINQMDENQYLFQVNLTLTNDSDKDLHVLAERIREEIDPDSKEWYRLGKILLKIGEFEKVQQVYEVLLLQTKNDIEKALIYQQMGWIKDIKGEYKEAITFYEKALEIRQQLLPPNHPDLAESYIIHGTAYDSLGEYSKAITFYEHAVEIQKQSLPPNHLDLAISFNNIGLAYDNRGEYSKALFFHEKALEIRQQSLPSYHSDLAASYDNIADVYYNMGQYSKALLSYENAFEIKQKSLPPNHPDLAESYNNIGAMYDNMGEYSKALLSYENTHKIWQQSLPLNHPDLSTSYNNIGNVYHSMGEDSKALSYFEKALEIRQQSLSPNHPDLAKSYITHGMVYNAMSDYPKAVVFYEYAIEIQKQSLPSNHPDLAMSYNNIGNVYDNMGEYSKALWSHEKAFEIQQQLLPSNHPDLAVSFNNSGLVYENMGDYSKAHSLYECAMDIAQQSLPSNHPHLQMYRNNIEVVKRKLELVVTS